ncbi:hypothetical protein B9Z19DRAFT_971769 [Tuber borchii]|uniref:Uncharacterized protein n=1 Tax=Tuber borchii TaxID=42251 RepID=A0A2T7A0Y9_TUBBO|nr:hypothetical protein B9Z19DRAFT_971769 [Tuber borchii]
MSQLTDDPDSYQYCERPHDVLALRRHISTNGEDRFFHSSSFGEANRTTWSTTLSFYQVHESRPRKDCAPLAETGIFTSGFPTHDGDDKYIRQDKLTFSFTSISGDWENVHLSPRERNFWQLIAINPPRMHCLRNDITGINTQIEPLSLRFWVESCLDGIREKWHEVLNELDRQISVTNSVLFNEEARIKFLFDDENFNNSKRYFWALQSLRVFSETMEETIQFLPHIFEKFYILGVDRRGREGGSGLQDVPTMEELNREMCDITAKHVANFEKIRDRIERKRQEVKGLSDGVSGILER